jgi:hypothetical protein
MRLGNATMIRDIVISTTAGKCTHDVAGYFGLFDAVISLVETSISCCQVVRGVCKGRMSCQRANTILHQVAISRHVVTSDFGPGFLEHGAPDRPVIITLLRKDQLLSGCVPNINSIDDTRTIENHSVVN